MSDLLTNFGGLLDEYARHREYIAKAQAQAEKFSKAVIEKVVLDHEVKSSGVADGVLPLVPEIESHIAQVDADTAGINQDKTGADEEYQELELRNAIGEMESGEFETLSSDLKSKLDEADSRLAELAEDRAAHTEALARWVELAAGASQDDGTSAAAEPEEEEEELASEPVVIDEPDGTHSSTPHTTEDVSAVFDDEGSAAQVEVDDGEDVAIEAGDADVDFGFEEDEGDVGEEVELNLVDGGDPGEEGADEIGIDLDVGSDDDDDEPADDDESEEAEASDDDGDDAEADEDDARRALLLYQEGTADEQIYPFTGEVLTVGRGRDNDIQIKNDSKVSRFHCKLFRRSGNFYIEDNKSSNGTLVNGELITERRLFGGEEVIIGETFFRFRIM
jgi:hypothetical protein